MAALGKELTHLSLPAYLSAARAPAGGKANNEIQLKFFAELNALVADTPVDQIQTYPRWFLLYL